MIRSSVRFTSATASKRGQVLLSKHFKIRNNNPDNSTTLQNAIALSQQLLAALRFEVLKDMTMINHVERLIREGYSPLKIPCDYSGSTRFEVKVGMRRMKSKTAT